MRRIFSACLGAALALVAAPARAQDGSLAVSLTIVQPAAAVVNPALRLRTGPDGMDVQADLQVRGAAVWGIAPTGGGAPSSCGAWTAEDRAAAARDDAVTLRTRCTGRALSENGARAPLVITLATN
jgi:hypothetical protein